MSNDQVRLSLDCNDTSYLKKVNYNYNPNYTSIVISVKQDA